MVGGHVDLHKDVDPILAATAYDQQNCVFIHDGEAYLVPMDNIDLRKVKKICNDKGCALVAK